MSAPAAQRQNMAAAGFARVRPFAACPMASASWSVLPILGAYTDPKHEWSRRSRVSSP
jgi:hypothetical protein